MLCLKGAAEKHWEYFGDIVSQNCKTFLNSERHDIRGKTFYPQMYADVTNLIQVLFDLRNLRTIV